VIKTGISIQERIKIFSGKDNNTKTKSTTQNKPGKLKVPLMFQNSTEKSTKKNLQYKVKNLDNTEETKIKESKENNTKEENAKKDEKIKDSKENKEINNHNENKNQIILKENQKNNEDINKSKVKEENKENKINKENIILDNIKLNPINENNEYGKFCNVVKEEIEKFYLMKNKIYVIFKYKNSDLGYIYNLLTLKKIQNRKRITYNEYINKLQEIDKETLNSWCNIDIKTGCLNIILYNEKCFNNNIKNLNLNFVEEIIKREFSIISSNDLYLDMNNNNNDNDKNNKKMERTKKKIYVNN
jgi:hypothetical protein